MQSTGNKPNKTYKKKKPKKITLSYLRNSGLFYLQRYVASSFQFERAMKRKIDRSCYEHKEQDKEECYKWLAEVTEEFRELGYLNDEAYLKGMLQSLRFSKGLSRRMIFNKMREKGFAEYEVIPVLEKLENQQSNGHIDSELEAGKRFSERKKLGPYHPTPSRKTYEQQLATMARAGFSYDICKKVLDVDEND